MLKLGALMALGFLLRLGAVTYGLPFDVFGDEFVHVATALSFLNGMTLVASQSFSYVPSFMALMLAPFFVLYGGIGIILHTFANVAAFKEFAILNTEWFMIGGRILSALFGTAFLGLIFLFAKQFMSSRFALLAAAFAAFDFWLVHESQIGHFWMPMTFFILAACYALLRVAQGGGKRWSLASAAMIAFGYWCGYVSVLLIPWFVLAHAAAKPRSYKEFFFSNGVLAFLFAGISWLNPVSFLRQFGRALKNLLLVAGIAILPDLPVTTGVGAVHPLQNALLVGRVIFDANPFLLCVALIGFVLIARRFKLFSFESSVLIGFPIAYYVVTIFIWTDPDPRYILPIIPFLVVSCAFALSELSVFLIKRMSPLFVRISVSVVAIGIILYTFAPTVQYTLLLQQPDTRVAAALWITEHIPSGAHVVLDAKKLTLPRDSEVLTYLEKNAPGELRTKDRFLIEKGEVPSPAYFVLSRAVADSLTLPLKQFDWYVNEYYPDTDTHDPGNGFIRVATFSPAQKSNLADTLSGALDPFAALTGLTNLGPYVVIYKRAE